MKTSCVDGWVWGKHLGLTLGHVVGILTAMLGAGRSSHSLDTLAVGESPEWQWRVVHKTVREVRTTTCMGGVLMKVILQAQRLRHVVNTGTTDEVDDWMAMDAILRAVPTNTTLDLWIQV